MPVVDLPWGAWYRDGRHRIELPEHWDVDVLRTKDVPACDSERICESLRSPIESPALRELAERAGSACVVVDDLARPTRASDVLTDLFDHLHEGGLEARDIRVVVATGSHAALTKDQIAWKVGSDVVTRYHVECHDCRRSLSPTGIRYGDRELLVNRTFHQADLKIAVGSVLPHSFAGNSGGAKLVLPGLTDLRATARSHKFVQLGLRGGSDPNENRFRLEAEEFARRIGLAFVVCVVTNSRRETVSVHAGDPVAAHRQACAVAADVFRTEVRTEYDCVVLNAYPKDIDLIQAENAFVAIKAATSPIVRSGGVIVLSTAASEGMGRHGLFEPGGVSYRKPVKKRALGDRELWLYVPNMPTDEVRKLFWEGYPVFHNSHEMKRALADRFPGETRSAVFPYAPAQQVNDLRGDQVPQTR